VASRCADADRHLGMVVALPAEARALLGRQRWIRRGGFAIFESRGPSSVKTTWACCGIGHQRAAAAAAFLVEQGVTRLGIAGVSGGLDSGLASGDLIAARGVTDEAGCLWPADRQLCAWLVSSLGNEARCGLVLTTSEPLLTTRRKASWQARSEALAVDMESAAVANVATVAGKPFFVLRAVCDDARRSVPPALLHLVDEQGRPRLLWIAARLVRQPSLLPELLRMQGDFGRALKALRRGWRACCASDAPYFDKE